MVLISFSIDEITPASLIKLFLIKSIAPDPAFNAVLSSVGNDLDKIILICFETSVLKCDSLLNEHLQQDHTPLVLIVHEFSHHKDQ